MARSPGRGVGCRAGRFLAFRDEEEDLSDAGGWVGALDLDSRVHNTYRGTVSDIKEIKGQHSFTHKRDKGAQKPNIVDHTDK
jgi:hypothetical protein